VFLATFSKYCSQGLPTAFFLDITPSRMFTTNSLCPIVCPIHEWCQFFFKFLPVIFLLSPFEKLHHSLFYLSILFLTFFSSSMFQMYLQPYLQFIISVIYYLLYCNIFMQKCDLSYLQQVPF